MQQDSDTKHTSNRMAEKEKIQGFAVAQAKSTTRTGPVERPKGSCA